MGRGEKGVEDDGRVVLACSVPIAGDTVGGQTLGSVSGPNWTRKETVPVLVWDRAFLHSVT